MGAPAYSDGGQAGEGRAYVYLGSAAGLAATAAWRAESNQAVRRLRQLGRHGRGRQRGRVRGRDRGRGRLRQRRERRRPRVPLLRQRRPWPEPEAPTAPIRREPHRAHGMERSQRRVHARHRRAIAVRARKGATAVGDEAARHAVRRSGTDRQRSVGGHGADGEHDRGPANRPRVRHRVPLARPCRLRRRSVSLRAEEPVVHRPLERLAGRRSAHRMGVGLLGLADRHSRSAVRRSADRLPRHRDQPRTERIGGDAHRHDPRQLHVPVGHDVPGIVR